MVDYPTGEMLAACIADIDAAELVQTGGQKAVYKALIKGHTIALKLISVAPEKVTSEEDDLDISTVVGRAQREVAILDQVDVPVLARRGPLGLFMVDVAAARWLCFTEEWIEGKNLQEMIREARLSPVQVTQLGIDLVQATCWLSGRGLVHRDIKPANVMWTVDSSRFVLLDTRVAFDLHGPSLTMVPVMVGTMAYLSPEQMDPSRKRALDFRSDLFAIGVVLYEAAVSEHPFKADGTSLSQTLAGILTITPPPVAERIEGFPLDLSAFIARLLGKAPHLRYRRCDHAKAAIEEVAVGLGVKI